MKAKALTRSIIGEVLHASTVTHSAVRRGPDQSKERGIVVAGRCSSAEADRRTAPLRTNMPESCCPRMVSAGNSWLILIINAVFVIMLYSKRFCAVVTY